MKGSLPLPEEPLPEIKESEELGRKILIFKIEKGFLDISVFCFFDYAHFIHYRFMAIILLCNLSIMVLWLLWFYGDYGLMLLFTLSSLKKAVNTYIKRPYLNKALYPSEIGRDGRAAFSNSKLAF